MNKGGDTVWIRAHPPERVVFHGGSGGGPGPEFRRALEDVLLRAVATALERLQPADLRIDLPPVAGPEPAPQPAAGSPGPPAALRRPAPAPTAPALPVEEPAAPEPGPPEPVPTARLTLAMSLPADLVEGPPEPATPATAPPPVPAAGPPGQPAEPAEPADRVVEGPSPVDGRVVMILAGSHTVTLGAERYIRASNIMRVLELGRAAFGRGSFAVLRGPLGEADSGLWAIATNRSVSVRELVQGSQRWTVGRSGQSVATYQGEVLRGVTDSAGHDYQVLAVTSTEGEYLTQLGIAAENLQELIEAAPPVLEPEEVGQLVFAGVDRLVEQVLAGRADLLREAVDRLARLDRVSFGLTDWNAKRRYLQVLLSAGPDEKYQRAIVELLCSLRSRTELHTLLAEKGLVERLYHDLDENLWELLTSVGKRFGKAGKLTVEDIVELIERSLGIGANVRESLLEIAQGAPEHAAWSALAEIQTAVVGVWDFVVGLAKGLHFMLTKPLDVISGLGQLVRLVVSFQLAYVGYPPAQAECAALLRKVGDAILDALKGVAVLQEAEQSASVPPLGEQVLRKIRWAVLIELASWFVGAGELKAAARAVGLTEKTVAMLRILGVTGRLRNLFEADLIAVRLTRVARAMRQGSAVLRSLRSDAEVLRLISELPVADELRLTEALARAEVREGHALSVLVTDREIGEAVTEAVAKVEALQILARKSGGLTEELGEVFRRLAGPEGFTTEEVRTLVKELAPDEGARLLAVLEHIGLERVGPHSAVGADFLTLLVAEPRRMNAVQEFGHPVLLAVFDRAAGKAEHFDSLLVELARLKLKARQEHALAEYVGLLDRLTAGDAEAWALLTHRGVEAAELDTGAMLQRISRLRLRYLRRAKDPRVVENQIRRLRRLAREDREKALAELEKFEAHRPDRPGAPDFEQQMAADAEEAGKWATQDEKLLHHEPGEAPSEAPGVHDERHPKTGRDRASSDLGDRLEAAGEPRLEGHEPHHIAPDADPRGELARQILREAGIDPRNSPLNGVWLPRTSADPSIVVEALTRHPLVHTNAYYRELTLRLLKARREGRVHEVIAQIKFELKNGIPVEDLAGARRGETYAQWMESIRGEAGWLTDEEFDEVVEATRRAPPDPQPATPAAPQAAPGAGPAPDPQPPPEEPPVRQRVAPEEPAGPPPEQLPEDLLEELPEEPSPAPAQRRLRRPGDDSER
ncbi:AHH domain-containing protein [Streptomyces sp. NPDC053427]|uniref:AHH domain-containing protein n=1 Tax=Streptomyces sp. NPDC053427 TaxID=3365701 RepID=UPI0037D09A04